MRKSQSRGTDQDRDNQTIYHESQHHILQEADGYLRAALLQPARRRPTIGIAGKAIVCKG